MALSRRGGLGLTRGLGAAGLAVIGLGLVVLASRGDHAADRSAAFRVPGLAGSSVAVLLGAVLVAWLVLGVVFLVLAAAGRRSGDGGGPRGRWATWVVPILLGVLLAALLLPRAQPRSPEPRPGLEPAETTVPPASVADEPASGAVSSEVSVLLLAAAAAGLALTAVLLARRREATADEVVDEQPDESLRVEAAERAAPAPEPSSLLDEVVAETDPRRSVLLAYAAMERLLARSVVARRPAEAPHQWLNRIRAGRPETVPMATRLTRHYERARFSDHPVDGPTRADAIAALTGLIDTVHRESAS